MSQSLAWTMLVASGLIDVAWAYATKRSDGFSNLGWSLLSLVFLTLFITLLTRALAVLPLGTAYVVWTGIGAAGSLLVSFILLGEPVTAMKLGLAALILIGVIGLKLTST